MRDVGSGIAEVRLWERAARPVGELGALVELNAQETLHELSKRAGPIPAEQGCDLCVEHVPRDGARDQLQDLQVLRARVHDAHRVALKGPRSERTSTASASTSAIRSRVASCTSASWGRYVRSRWNSVSSA